MSHKYLILGLLAEHPMTGYDIRKRVQDVLNVVTNASYGTLYPTLHSLLEEGAVDVQVIEQDNRPSKKIYRITERGESDLTTWLGTPPVEDKVKREFLLKLYFAHNLSTPVLQGLLTQRRDELRTKLDTLCAERDTIDDMRHQWIVDYSISICRAEMNWLEQMESQIQIA